MTSPFEISIETDDRPDHWPFATEQGKVVFERTYSRTKPDGSKETWFDTTRRVARGNLAFVYGNDMDAWTDDVKHEYDRLVEMMDEFKLMPGGRHLWTTGVPGRQFVSNCFVSHWTEKLSEHFSFTLLRLAEGGGVGANYSQKYTGHYPKVARNLKVHIVCDPSHPNFNDMKDAGLISDEYSHEWTGAFQVEDSREGWADAMSDLLDTYVKEAPVAHQNRVYDVSRLRSKGSILKTMGGVASGPEPFAAMLHNISNIINQRFGKKLRSLDLMEIDHEIGACVVAGGNRRSARMSMLHWDDPYIMDFIKCKNDPGKHWTTNISVEIDEDFIQLVQMDSLVVVNEYDELLVDRANIIRKYAKAHKVYKAIITGMLTNGEPGMWNSTLSNKGEVGEVVCTNPCGEIPLEPWESCILGHVNLDAFSPPEGYSDWSLSMANEHWNELYEAHRLMTRFLIRATYGTMSDEKQKEVVGRNRRIGVGHLGTQAFLAKQGRRVSELTLTGDPFADLLAALYTEVRQEARSYAFELRIPEPVKVTTLAPTGTTAKTAGTTEAAQNIYSPYFERRIRFSTVDPKEVAQFDALVAKGYYSEVAVNEKDTMIVVLPTKDPLVEQVEALGWDADVVESQADMTLRDMLKIQAIYQLHYADNAVSFTCNIPASPEQNAYFMENPWGTEPPAPTAARIQSVGNTVLEWLPHLKGTTIMVDGTRPQAPYTRISKEEFEAASVTATEDGINGECQTGACPVR